MSESLPLPTDSVIYVNHFLSRCHSLSLQFITQLVWYLPGTDLFHIEMIMKYCVCTSHRICKGELRLFWCLNKGLLLWVDEPGQYWPWSEMLLASLYGTCAWVPLTKCCYICIAANHTFHLSNVSNMMSWLCESNAICTTVLTPF